MRFLFDADYLRQVNFEKTLKITAIFMSVAMTIVNIIYKMTGKRIRELPITLDKLL